jgi:transcription antitermination factor NusA-like protein
LWYRLNILTQSKIIRSLSITVPKKKHRLIIGSKASNLQEVHSKTGCIVDVPSIDDPSELIWIRGPEAKLSLALQIVLEKVCFGINNQANSIMIEDIDIKEFLPPSLSPVLFTRFLFGSLRSVLKEIEAQFDCSIINLPSCVIELQGKNQDSFENAKETIVALLQEKAGNTFIRSIQVPLDNHRYLVGKGGQNIAKTKTLLQWDGRISDILAQPMGSSSDEVLLVVLRKPDLTASASDKEVYQFTENLKEFLIGQAATQADLISTSFEIESKFHGKIIGSGGIGLKDLKALGPSTHVKFPHVSAPSNLVSIKGPKDEVSAVIAKLEEIVKEMKKVEKLTGFVAKVQVPNEDLPKFIGGNGREIGWILKGIRDRYANGTFATKDEFEKGLLNSTDSLHINVSVENGETHSSLVIVSSKNFVAQAKAIVESRLENILNTLDMQINIFAGLSTEAQELLNGLDMEAPMRIVKHLIGKDGHALKILMNTYAAEVNFSKDKMNYSDISLNNTDNPCGTVHLKGEKAGVLAIKESFLKICEEKVWNYFKRKILKSFIVKFPVFVANMSAIIGKGGSQKANLSKEYGVKINIGSEESGGCLQCEVEGAEKDCLKVKELITGLGIGGV